MKKLFVGNLSSSTTQQALSSLFEKLGTVLSCVVVKDRMTGMSRGFAFVEMESNSAATEALRTINGQLLDGKEIKVIEARTQDSGDSRGGSNRSGPRAGGGYSGSSARSWR